MIGAFVALAIALPPVPQGPSANHYAAEVLAALADARRLGPAVAAQTRYLSMFNYPEEIRAQWRKAIDYYANSTSRSGQLYRVRQVGSLLAINVYDYGPVWPATFENFAAVDPHFHVQLTFDVGQTGKRYFAAETGSKAGWYEAKFQAKKTVSALAPWLPPVETAELVALTQSATPILRADFFFSQAAVQAERKNTGYYSFLGVKTVADYDKLIGFSRKEAQEREYEVAAIVSRSGVARFGRQVFIEQALTGPRAETRDVLDDNANEHNAQRQLLDDYKPQAFEIYGFNTVGLFVYAAADDKGALQDSVPDRLGPDKTAPGNDTRIHPFLSCVRCHIEGYRPVNDWGRKVYTGGTLLTSPDPVQHRRLTRVYLGDLQTPVDEANAKYARALKALTGWKPEEAAKAVGLAWAGYIERDYLPADLAAELGVPEDKYLVTLRAYYTANRLGDPVLASHLADPPLPIRSDDVEQLYPLVAPVILGGTK